MTDGLRSSCRLAWWSLRLQWKAVSKTGLKKDCRLTTKSVRTGNSTLPVVEQVGKVFLGVGCMCELTQGGFGKKAQDSLQPLYLLAL